MRSIPKRFQLLNHTIGIETIPMAKWKWDAWAYWDHENLKILICRGKRSIAFHSFCHEVVHALFDMAGRHDLSADETLVDTVGGLLAQMMSTAE